MKAQRMGCFFPARCNPWWGTCVGLAATIFIIVACFLGVLRHLQVQWRLFGCDTNQAHIISCVVKKVQSRREEEFVKNTKWTKKNVGERGGWKKLVCFVYILDKTPILVFAYQIRVWYEWTTAATSCLSRQTHLSSWRHSGGASVKLTKCRKKKRYMKQFEPCVSSFIFFDLSLRCIHLQYTFKANFLLNYLDPRMGQHEKMCCKKVGATRRALSLAYETTGMMCVCCAGADIMTFWSTCSSHVCPAFPTKGARKLWECTPGAHVTLTANGQFFRCQI